MGFKVIVDTFASLAALVAILSVLVGWYSSARKPLSISRVVVHKKDGSLKYILVMKNRKSYPVETKKIDCYTRKTFEIEQRVGEKPEYIEKLSSRYAVFSSKVSFKVPAKGNIHISIEVDGQTDISDQLIFSIDTTHGYHEISCKNITVIEIGKAVVYSVEFKKECVSKSRAKMVYLWRRIVVLTRCFSRPQRRA